MKLGPATGWNWLLGGLLGAVLLPVLSIELNLPFAVALASAALSAAGCVVLFAPRRLFDGLDARTVGQGKLELARELLGDAEIFVARLEAAARSIAAASVKFRVGNLSKTARSILASVEQDPMKLDRARRFLIYYLPRAAEMAEGYRLLEQKKLPDAARLDATRDLLDRLDGAFSKIADGLLEADVGQLDIELKLLKSSLDDELGPVADAQRQGRI